MHAVVDLLNGVFQRLAGSQGKCATLEAAAAAATYPSLLPANESRYAAALPTAAAAVAALPPGMPGACPQRSLRVQAAHLPHIALPGAGAINRNCGPSSCAGWRSCPASSSCRLQTCRPQTLRDSDLKSPGWGILMRRAKWRRIPCTVPCAGLQTHVPTAIALLYGSAGGLL